MAVKSEAASSAPFLLPSEGNDLAEGLAKGWPTSELS